MLDVHLMIVNPEKVIDDYIKAGADILTIHYESTKNVAETLKLIKSKNVVAGLAINPKTPALKIKDLLDEGLVDIVGVADIRPEAGLQEKLPHSRHMP
jgi:ribulose-phosphate 3-epimerase